MCMEAVKFEITLEDAGQRLDKFISFACGLSRTVAQQLIAQGNVLVGSRKPSKSYTLQNGDCLAVTIPPPVPSAIQPENIPLTIVYEDANLLVVNKPKGMVVHPAPGNYTGTLVNALLYHCGGTLSGIGGEIRPGIVHRIDKDTSGLLVVAKDDNTHQSLSQQFANHSIERTYHTAVYGTFAADSGVLSGNLARSMADRKKMTVVNTGGKHAVTHYVVITRYNGFSHLAVQLETGRTHQIRVHMAAAGHPVAGDAVYGPKKVIKSLHGQCLHAKSLGFIHPASGQPVQFDSELPAYFQSFLGKLQNVERGRII